MLVAFDVLWNGKTRDFASKKTVVRIRLSEVKIAMVLNKTKKPYTSMQCLKAEQLTEHAFCKTTGIHSFYAAKEKFRREPGFMVPSNHNGLVQVI